ncbi:MULTISPECIES: MFS transporter [Nocardia]|uniref:MFS transporter n=1 Tax=Nocardia TaxID=1817 RepID=UPI0024548A9C|nr:MULTISPECIES: MFS transporter [Nocardia]
MTGHDGFVRFRLIWFGQLLSVLGSGASWFAVTVWAWQNTGSATQFALLTFCSFAAGLLSSPVAGVLVDRFPRKMVILLCDSTLAVTSVGVLVLYSVGELRPWHLMIVGAIEGVFETAHWLAYATLISDLVPADKLSRANGMVSVADPASEILAPAIGGVLLSLSSLGGIIVVDLATYLIAVVVLVFVPVPDRLSRKVTGAEKQASPSFRSGLTFGFAYIWRRRALLTLVALFFVMNLVGGVAYALNTPLVLLRSGNDAAAVGVIVAVAGVGGMAGAALMSTWNGPRRRAQFIAVGVALGCLFGPLLMSLSHNLALWLFATFWAALVPPVVNTVYQTIWQSEVPSDEQGRVFAARRFVTQLAVPVGLLGAGPLVDSVLAGRLTSDSIVAPILGHGVEGGAAALIGGVALLGIAASVVGLLSKRLRELDRAAEPRVSVNEAAHGSAPAAASVGAPPGAAGRESHH